MPKIYDISVPLSEKTLPYPGDVPFSKQAELLAGRITVTSFTMSAHLGTHVDAPKHFFVDGEGIDQWPLNKLIGPACVLDLRGLKTIDAADIDESLVQPGDIVFCKTDNGPHLRQNEFWPEFVGLTLKAAEKLVQLTTSAVGIDYLSIENGETFEVHPFLLQAEVPIIETIDLTEVPAGRYYASCLPLRVVGGDGAPARAVLIAEESGVRSQESV
jgi:arylformamidase